MKYPFNSFDMINWWDARHIRCIFEFEHCFIYASQQLSHNMLNRFFFKQSVITSKVIRAMA